MAQASGGYYTNGLTIATMSDLTADSVVPMDTQADGGSAPQTLAVPLGLAGGFLAIGETGVTAHAGGGQTDAELLGYGLNTVTVVATNADSVKLPPAVAGAVVVVANEDAAQSIQVFGGGTSTINGIATGTGVAQAAAITAYYICTSGTGDDVAGTWRRILSA